MACGLLDPFDCGKLPLDAWASDALKWLVSEYRPVFQSLKWPVDQALGAFESAMTGVPPTVMLIILGLIAWQLAGGRIATVLVASLVFIGFLGIWEETMTTLAIVLTALSACLVIGVPLGIWAARSDRFYGIIRPLLDGMQTIPAFVYLVPVVMLFGIGNVSGVIVTVIFAVAPVIRLTNLGIRQVPHEVVEAMLAYGATPRQLLFRAQIPLAMPTIMAGVNQTLMMSLSMVVVASMIAVGGLGQMVLRGIGRLDMGTAIVGGLGIVVLAIVLDRLTQAMQQGDRRTRATPWHQRGPVAAARAAYASLGRAAAPAGAPRTVAGAGKH
jgi:glycine betaine/proline transport system permease protein